MITSGIRCPLVRPFAKACARTPKASGHVAALQRRDILPLMMLSPSLASLFGRSVATAAAMSEAEKVLLEPNWSEEFPFRDDMFGRYDEAKDTAFYSSPRFVTHIDDNAIKALTKYYGEQFPTDAEARKNTAVLDICSSWISHYPAGFTAGKVSGLGMNEDELKRNPVLTDYVVKDLNDDPTLPYPDNTFDFVTNAVSVDYLTKPLAVFQEMHRVLKPGGKAIMSFSNRCFPTKAIAVWTMTGDLDHIYIVGAYFHYSVPGGFSAPTGHDITLPASRKGKGDPMYVVQATKL